MKYYKVQVKCGHVGTDNYGLITFYIKAKDYKDAINQALSMPSVKYDCNTAIHSLKPIKEEEYLNGREMATMEEIK